MWKFLSPLDWSTTRDFSSKTGEKEKCKWQCQLLLNAGAKESGLTIGDDASYGITLAVELNLKVLALRG